MATYDVTPDTIEDTIVQLNKVIETSLAEIEAAVSKMEAALT